MILLHTNHVVEHLCYKAREGMDKAKVTIFRTVGQFGH
jgi:hypothetical protein